MAAATDYSPWEEELRWATELDRAAGTPLSAEVVDAGPAAVVINRAGRDE